MKTKKYLLSTLHNYTKHTDTISHQLMLRSGMIRKLSSGIYAWLPTGQRVIQNIINIITKKMNKINALEICLPVLNPQKLWDASGRTKLYGKELLKFSNRRGKKFILSPTHEEIVTKILKNEIHSFKQLPLIVYQIQKKFRDEIRPRFGIIRTIEFLMKDAYSFHNTLKSLEKTYQKLLKIYIEIFKEFKLKFKIVPTTSKIMGGFVSHEFHAFSKTGEDTIVYPEKSQYAKIFKNISEIQNVTFPANILSKKKIFNKSIQILYLKTHENSCFLYSIILLKKKHTLNFEKLKNISELKKPICLFKRKKKKYNINFILKNTKKLKIFLIGDIKVKKLKYFILFKKKPNIKKTNIFWNTQIKYNQILKLNQTNKRNEISYNIKDVKIQKSIEIGHIFQLGTKYSKIINFSITKKKKDFLHMGCYGIGINRIISAIIEQNHDKKGIIWPEKISPFQVAIAPINMRNNPKIKKLANLLYKNLSLQGIEILFDNRPERIGFILKDLELLGIPNILIISKKTIINKQIEFYSRKKNTKTLVLIKNILKNFKKTQKSLNI
ncbi:proline--tRNA ligase [Buchnera aphidicola]|uniref:proline--tRNA ligase n=1 Tax=Buchnera aphidicola TaxID=9 RepID=UPI0031B6CD02